MKVCLLNDSFPPVIDGVVNVIMNYADYLMKDHSAEVMIGTPKYPDADYSSYPYKVIPYQSFDTASMTNGYRTGNPFAGREVQEMAAFSPDLIHSHCPASATVIARLLREETEAPVVFTYHTKYDIDIERFLRVKAIAKQGIKAMVSNIEACDDIWVVSRGAGESLKALGFQGEYRVVNNGVDFEKGRVSEEEIAAATAGYDLPEGVPVFLFVGRMMTYKNIPLILDALKLLSDAGQDFRMVLIGKGPDQELLENMAAERDLMDTVHSPGKCIFTGPVYDRNVLRAWNCRADLFLFPSTFDTNGLVVREAAACGLASVLVEDSCAAEGITDNRNGFIIQETAESMAELLKTVSKDTAHLHDVGQHAMEEIYLSWQSCVNDVYDRYQWVLEEKKRGAFVRKKLPTDYMVALTAHNMSEQERHRQIRKAVFGDFKDTAVGMMENILEAEENTEKFFDRLKTDIQEAGEHAGEYMERKKSAAQENVKKGTEKIEKFLENRAADAEELHRKGSEKLDRYMEERADQISKQMKLDEYISKKE